jgi:PAS domain S-box-containing protein
MTDPSKIKLTAKDTADWLAGGGEMGARVRAFDWASHPLGPLEGWPQSLKIAVRIMLTSRYAMWMGWGTEFYFFCNDAYLPTVGLKESWVLGASARQVWAEIWPDIGPRAEAVVATGNATWDESLLLFLERSGYAEETYHTFSYSPISNDDGSTGGMLCVVTEETERVIGERRLRLLRELAADLTKVNTEEEIFETARYQLGAHDKDVPFALLYLFDADGQRARQVCAQGQMLTETIAPPVIELDAANPVWPAQEVLRRTDSLTVVDLTERFAVPPLGPWNAPIRQAAIVPIAQQGQERPAGFLVAGINPFRPLDTAYLGFINLLAGQLGSALANARAYEAERQRAEALAELDRAKTAFFSNVSHEFRTPLTLMLGPLEDALAEADQDQPNASIPPERERLALIHRNGLRLLKLVNSLLDFSRIEAGRVQAFFEPTDLAMFTRDLASVFRSAVERAGLELVIDCSPLAEPVYVDREMWEKIVLNLLSNAFKFTFEGRIEVHLRPVNDMLELMVRDTGIGIAAEELPRLFERFHRIEGARGRTHEGSGIGLALVQELVKTHGGTVRVESEPGQGSTFIVSIPCGLAHLPTAQLGNRRTLSSTATSATAYVEEALRWLPEKGGRDWRLGTESQPLSTEHKSSLTFSPQPLTPNPSARILLADDNADMRAYVRRLLAENYEVETVADGEAALAAARAQPPDLVLSDIMMPRLDGFGLLRELRADERTATIPIILLSARAGEEARLAGLEAGADDYLTKPFSARELLARVESNLKLQRSRREAAQREEELLRQNARQLALITDTAPVFIAHCDLEGRFKFVNQAYAARFGLKPADCLGKRISEIVGKEGYESFRQYVETALRGEPVEFDVEIPYESIGKRFMHASYVPEFDANGKVAGFVAAITDITQRKRAEDALRESEERFAKAFNASPLTITLTSLKTGQLVEVNETFVRVTGYTRAEALGKTTLELGLWSPADRAAELAAVQRAGLIRNAEYKFRMKDGTEIVGLLSAELLEIGGEPCALTVIQDITERKRAEEVVRESEVRFRTLAEALPHLVWVSSADGERLEYLNAQWLIYTGLTYEESLANANGAIHPDDVAGAGKAWLAARQAEEPYEFKLRLRRADGAYRWFLSRSIPLHNEAGQILRWVGTSTDIHEQIEEEQDARFLGDLGEHIGVAENAEVLLAATARLVAEHLQVARCLFIEIDQAKNRGVVRHQYPQHMAPFAGGYQLSDYSPITLAEVEAGRSVVNRDAQTDPRTADYYEKTYCKTGERAYVAVPLRRAGRWAATLWVSTEQPRDWQPREVALLETVAERVWLAVEKLRLDAEMRRTNERFELAESASQGFVYEWHVPEGVVERSRGLAAVLGYEPDEVPTTQEWWQEQIHPDDFAQLEAQRQQFAESAVERIETEYRVRHRNGHWVILRDRARLIHTAVTPSAAQSNGVGQDGVRHLVRMVGTSVDITDRKAKEAQIERLLAEEQAAREAAESAMRAKDEFLAVISHELRSPLNAILGWTRLLGSQRKDDPEVQRITEIIQRNGRTQIQLIEDLLDTARIISGKLKLDTRPVEVREVLSAALDNVRPAAESKRITLVATFEPAAETALGDGASSYQVMADADRLQQVFWNLLSNAVKFTPEDGRVQVTLKRSDVMVQIVISDTGQGIGPDLLPHVFDRFRQGDSSSSRRFGGLGLGLALARHLIEMHGGQVTVESAGEGQGATFTVRLPIQSDGMRNSEAQVEAVNREGGSFLESVLLVSNVLDGVRVLVVDDDASACELVALTLRQAGAQVAVANTAAGALATLEAASLDGPFDLLLSDIGMPVADGYELMQQVRAHSVLSVRNVRAVALTAYARLEDRLQALQAGYQTHLAKPIEEDELITVVASLTGRL